MPTVASDEMPWRAAVIIVLMVLLRVDSKSPAGQIELATRAAFRKS
jgi:hypothetical protein